MLKFGNQSRAKFDMNFQVVQNMDLDVLWESKNATLSSSRIVSAPTVDLDLNIVVIFLEKNNKRMLDLDKNSVIYL